MGSIVRQSEGGTLLTMSALANAFRVRRWAVPAVFAVIAVMMLGLAAPANADTVSQIANGLRSSKLYVTTDAQGALDTGARARVEQSLDGAKDADIRIVVTDANASQQSTLSMLKAVASRVGKGNVYLAVTQGGRIDGVVKKDLMSGGDLNKLIAQSSGDRKSVV